MTPKLIALTGLAGSGKSTAASALVETGFVRVSFAAPLKAMMAALYEHAGLPASEIKRRIEGPRKQESDPLLGDQTPRYAMQTLGTEWGRDTIFADLWANAAIREINRLMGLGVSVVVDDCRFPNEADAIRSLGGFIIRIKGRGGIEGGHASEKMEFEADDVLHNRHDLETFKAAVVGTYGPGGEFWENAFDDLGLNDTERRTVDRMLREYEDALGLKPVFASTRHVAPHATEQQALDIPDVRPGVSSEQAKDVAREYLREDHNRLAHAQRALDHLGPCTVRGLNTNQRVRFVFYLDCDSAGIPWSFAECDDYLSAVIGGEQ